MVHSLDPIDRGWEFADELAQDRTLEIAETIAITEAGGTDVIDSIASGLGAANENPVVLCPAGTKAWIDHAREQGRSLAAVTPLGSRLPPMLWSRYLDLNVTVGNTGAEAFGEAIPGEHELIALDVFDELIGSAGLTPPNDWRPDCPDVAELARR